MAAAWRGRLRRRIEKAAVMLGQEFGASRVLLFGSFARAEASPGSDVDLLATGIPFEKILDATVAAERIIEDAQVDLVPAEAARPFVHERAESEGVILYGG
jgi:predicted nucleotidyltransferase